MFGRRRQDKGAPIGSPATNWSGLMLADPPIETAETETDRWRYTCVDQLVGVVDHPLELGLVDGTVEFDSVPVPLVLDWSGGAITGCVL